MHALCRKRPAARADVVLQPVSDADSLLVRRFGVPDIDGLPLRLVIGVDQDALTQEAISKPAHSYPG